MLHRIRRLVRVLLALVIALGTYKLYSGDQLSPIAGWLFFGTYWAAVAFATGALISASPLVLDPLLSQSEPQRAGWLRKRLVTLARMLNTFNSYRRHNRPLYAVLSFVVLSTVFMLAAWWRWWTEVGRNYVGDPSSFLPVYIFLIILQVAGVILTIVVVERIRPGRIQTPAALFEVFHDAVVEAAHATATPIVLHHIAPVPGLFEMLDQAIMMDAAGHMQPVGAWKRYLESVRAVGRGSTPPARVRLILPMISYWHTQSGRREYKGSSLYHFAVMVCEAETKGGKLLERATGSASSIAASGGAASPQGVIRYWYHLMVFALLTTIEEGIGAGVIELWLRDVVWPPSVNDLERQHLGYTFVAGALDAYIGLPRVAGGAIRFDGKHIDFQHEAIRDLEQLVRTTPASPGSGAVIGSWRKISPTELAVPLDFGHITGESES